jgi:hypothetical protein
MDGVAAGFIIVVLILGGVSAFVADILGYKIGKKRLSIWHIRPKHVARISVTVAGVLIPLLTILALYAASSDFREWLTRGRLAIRELEGKTRQLKEVTNSYEERVRENTEIGNKNRLIQSDLTKKQSELDKLATTLKDRQTKLTNLQGLMASAESKISQLKFKNEQTLNQFKLIRGQLAKSQQNLAKDQKSLKAIQLDLKNTIAARNLSIDEKNRAIRDFNEISKRNDDLTRNLGELQKNIEVLMTEIATLKDQSRDAALQTREAIRDLEALRSEVKVRLSEISDLKAEKDQLIVLRDAYGTFSRTKSLIYAADDEVVRQLVPARISRNEAQILITNLLRTCRVIAAAKGAKENKDYSFPGEAGVLSFDKASGKELDQESVREEMLQDFANHPENRVVVMRAFLNRFAGEPVALRYVFFANKVVFREGEIIAESRADGRESLEIIFGQIQYFVRNNVNEKARAVKMVPVSTKDGEVFGELTPSQILNAVALIKSTERVIRLQAVARREIRAGDPLTFELVIK